MKLITVLCLTLLAFAAYAEVRPRDYVMVAVAGFGTRRPDDPWQPSGVHEYMPSHHKLVRSYQLVHYAKKIELQNIIDDFQCVNGQQTRKDLGLIVTINSWGAGRGFQLTEMYLKQCGRKADLVFMIDGVSKPIGRFGKTPHATKCVSYYQTKGVVRGMALVGCENFDLTNSCDIRGLGAVDCHIHVEWAGAALARLQILNKLN